MLTTPQVGFPYPELGDVPNGQTAFQNLANHIDAYNIPRFADPTARNNAYISKYGSLAAVPVGSMCWIDSDPLGLRVMTLGGVWRGRYPVEFVVKSADTARTLTTTSTIDPHLQFSVTGGTHYADFHIIYSGNTAVDIKAALAISGSTFVGYGRTTTGIVPTGTSQTGPQVLVSDLIMTFDRSFGTFTGTGLYGYLRLTAVFAVASTGTVGFSWSQVNSSALPVTVHAGSYVRQNRF